MTLVEGLTSASLALGIVKELKSVGRSVDDATFKLKIAELMEALADTKISLSDAKLTLLEKDGQIQELEGKLRDLSSGENCPVCKMAKMKTISVKPHPELGVAGLQEKYLSCENEECGHSEKRMHDPNGLLNK